MVAIKDMEMPKSCRRCPLTYPRWDFNIGCKCCRAILGRHEEYGEYKTQRHPDCPLVEIITCKDCNNHGLDREHHPDIDGARYCPTLHTYTGHDFYCGDAERRE